MLNIVGSPVHLSKTVMNLVDQRRRSHDRTAASIVVRTENRHLEHESKSGTGRPVSGDFVMPHRSRIPASAYPIG
ncbi:MAG: hypothetical protein MZV70_15145 [Desulfobacterales bacterium]|nr:hypothetical protein [Desulfobacterales bacterium]